MASGTMLYFEALRRITLRNWVGNLSALIYSVSFEGASFTLEDKLFQNTTHPLDLENIG